MSDTIRNMLRASYRAARSRWFGMSDWKARSYAAPSPKRIKDQVLLRNAIPGASWVETGTFLGETTSLLAINSKHVHSLEPAEALYQFAAKKFRGVANVTIINGTSESVFPTLLPVLKGPTNFWLDGHFSAGATYHGELDTPVVVELVQIAKNLHSIGPVCVLIDDIRCFNPLLPEYATYPSLDFLVDWARGNGLKWHIEHDIFVAKSPDAL